MTRRIIDIHNHPNWHGHTVDDLVANMDELGIEKSWLLSWELPRAEYDVAPYYYPAMDPRAIGAPLWMIVEGLKAYPDRLIGGWAPDPRDKHARARLKAAVDLYGIKLYGEFKCRMRFDNPDAIAMYRYCAELNLPVLFHLQCPRFAVEKQCESHEIWVEWYGGDMTVVDSICEQCPETIFIGHAPGFWRTLSGDADTQTKEYPTGPVTPGGELPKLLRKHDNLYCDISAGSGCNAFTRDLEYGKLFAEEFQDRLLFGRDMFDDCHIRMLESLNLSEDILNKIYHKNAETLIPGD